jgi:hypothetical protein
MTTPRDVVFLFDLDNTLLDNDQIDKDLRGHLERIGDLVGYDLSELLGNLKSAPGQKEER